MDSEPWPDKRYNKHAPKIDRNDRCPGDPTTKMREDHLGDRLEAHQEEIIQDQATKEDKTQTCETCADFLEDCDPLVKLHHHSMETERRQRTLCP